MKAIDEQDRSYEVTISHEDDGVWVRFDDGWSEDSPCFLLDRDSARALAAAIMPL